MNHNPTHPSERPSFQLSSSNSTRLRTHRRRPKLPTNWHNNTWESEPSLTSNPGKLETKPGLKSETSNSRYLLGNCYINCDGNNWHFHANLSSGILLVQDGDLVHIGNMQKPNSLATPSWLGTGLQLPTTKALAELCKQWMSKCQHLCWLLRDNDRVLFWKGDSGAVLSRVSKKASRSKERLISIYIGVNQG